MAFLGKGKKQDMLQLAEELGINATLNMTVPSIKLQSLTVKVMKRNLLKICMRLSLQTEKDWKNEWLIGLEINTFQDLKDLMVVDQLKKRANASMKDHFLDNWANLKSATQIAELFDNYEDVRKGSVNGHEIDILRDTGATIDLVCAKYINPSSFSGENVWVKQPLSPELVCLPLAVVEISGNFGTVQTKAAVCGNHLNQHGRYLLGNKTAELIKGNLGYNFLPVEILNAVQTRSQVKAAREERGIDSGDAKKGEDERYGTVCKTCDQCQRAGKPNDKKKAPLKLVPVIQEVFTKLNIDACGPLPITSKGNRYLITAICMSSKFPEAIPVSDISSVSVTDALLNIFSRMGFPREIQCDQGTSFTSALTTEFLKDSEYLSGIVLCIIHRVTLLSDFIER
ncbi:retrovirus-related Pol polyprotein from transposon 412 [Trichonephila clavipes]|nr:retrovirus-related Pol polyprotein from transposon 412 [Trichonephila clavipes]